MKPIRFAIFFVLITSLFTYNFKTQAQGYKGDVIKEERAVKDFHSVSIQGVTDIILSQGTTEKLTIEADREHIGDVITEVKDGVLEIRHKKKMKVLNVYLVVKDLEELSVAGAADLKTEGVIKTNDLRIVVSGAGDIDLNIEANSIHGSITGAGDCRLTGKAEVLKFNITGAGDFNAYDLEANKVDLSIAGAGDAKINVKEELYLVATGAGDVRYRGEPKIKEVNLTGAGSLKSID